jgi:imidazolonepropionase-like amidohydrolase
MAEKGVWWCLQPFIDEGSDARFAEGSPNRLKQKQMQAGTDTAYALAKKYKIKMGWGADVQQNKAGHLSQNRDIVKMLRWFKPAEILKMITADNAELLALCGLRNPYQGKFGVVEEDALADLLLVDGDPTTNLELVEDPAKNFLVIMKDGKIYKNLVR